MMWEWIACFSMRRPLLRLTVQNVLPNSVSASPPHTSLTSNVQSLVPPFASGDQPFHIRRLGVINSNGNAAPPGGRDQFSGFFDSQIGREAVAVFVSACAFVNCGRCSKPSHPPRPVRLQCLSPPPRGP